MHDLYEDQSELKESAKGLNNGYTPLFNPGCWPENAKVGASVFIDCPHKTGNVVKFFYEEALCEHWLEELMGAGEVVSGELVCWPEGMKNVDAGFLMASVVKI